MFELESIQPSEEGEETESPSLETAESQELEKMTIEPAAQIEESQSLEQAEEIESTFVELVPETLEESKSAEVPRDNVVESTADESGSKTSEKASEDTPPPPELTEKESDTAQTTVVGEETTPDYSAELSNSQDVSAIESPPQTSEAVIDVIAKVLSDSEFRAQFFSKPEEALETYELTQDEVDSLGALREESIDDFANELEQRDVGFAPPYAPTRPSDEELVNVSQLLKAELTDEDLNRLLRNK